MHSQRSQGSKLGKSMFGLDRKVLVDPARAQNKARPSLKQGNMTQSVAHDSFDSSFFVKSGRSNNDIPLRDKLKKQISKSFIKNLQEIADQNDE